MMPEAGKGKKKAKTFDRIEYPRPAVTAIPIARGGVPHTSRLVWAPASHSAGRLRCRRWGPAGGWRSPAPPGAAPPPRPASWPPPAPPVGGSSGTAHSKKPLAGSSPGRPRTEASGRKTPNKTGKKSPHKMGKKHQQKELPHALFPRGFRTSVSQCSFRPVPPDRGRDRGAGARPPPRTGRGPSAPASCWAAGRSCSG